MLRVPELIERKRDGEELEPGELRELVLAYTRDGIPDYQMAAFLMAVYFRGLTRAEMHELCAAMVASGDTLDLSPLGRRVVDKHSTGGVGDKTSIALGPVVAACGVPFAKVSGRGLGHTGGTLDKLESIPGFRVEFDHSELLSQVADVGMAIVGQTAELVPADHRLYALRDVTATVDEISLIAASVMAKKIAAGADAIVLDVKVGDGAFTKTPQRAHELAEALLDLGHRAGRDVVCELTDMDQPLGHAVGNALEIREAVDVLRGAGPADVTELVARSAAYVLGLSDLGVDEGEGRRRAEATIADGSALGAYERWIAAQGGDPALEALPAARVVRPVAAPASGVVIRIRTRALGRAALRLGAGRVTKHDAIDHAVGVVCLAKRGDKVEAGESLAEIHAADDATADRAVADVAACYAIADDEPEPVPLVLDVLR